MKVMTALSGGVDSSVAAGLLQEAGYEVCGATLQLFGEPRQEARAAAKALGIPFYEFFEEAAFQKLVIDEFADSYARGETPNPCIICNSRIKFGLLLSHALASGQDALATGHYARLRRDTGSGRTLLLRARDVTKDQTYMLYLLTQEQLSKSLFPLGELTKKEIRTIAARMQLPCAGAPDSQDICFVPDGDYAGFLEQYNRQPCQAGDFVDEGGAVLGQHRGIIRYTVGQRKGLGIALGRPAFVLAKDAAQNRVILGPEDRLFSRRIIADRINWIACEATDGLRVTAKTRYSHREAEATLHLLEHGRVLAEFKEPQRAAAPGQALVFYDGEVVVGGGTITGNEAKI